MDNHTGVIHDSHQPTAGKYWWIGDKHKTRDFSILILYSEYCYLEVFVMVNPDITESINESLSRW